MMKQLRLYSTAHCHLCELAQSFLMQQSENVSVEIIDISNNADFLAKYGLLIPVLQRQDTKAQLHWPFSLVDITMFLK